MEKARLARAFSLLRRGGVTSPAKQITGRCPRCRERFEAIYSPEVNVRRLTNIRGTEARGEAPD